MRFVPLQHTLAAARFPHLRDTGADADRPGRFPLRRFRRRPARLVRSADRRRPPLRFCARGGRGSVSTVWRTFGVPRDRLHFIELQPTVFRAIAKWCYASSLNGTTFVFRNRCGFAPMSKRSRLRVHINRRRLAPSRIGSVIRRGRFSHATFRTFRDPPLPGRAVGFLPSCRPAALLGLHPSQVCSRSAGGRAG